MKKLIIIIVAISIFWLIYRFSKNDLIFVIRSDYPIEILDTEILVDDSIFINKQKLNINSDIDMKAFAKRLWFGVHSYKITSLDKKIDFEGNVFLFRDRIIEVYFINPNNNEFMIREVNNIVIE